MSIDAIDNLVNAALVTIYVICGAGVARAVWAYVIQTGDPDPQRLVVRLALVLAALVDNATWPVRGGVR